MSVQMFRDLEELINNAEHPVIAVVVAEGCDQFKGRFLTDFETALQKQITPVHLHVICYKEDEKLFPRPLTQVVYYFAPKNTTPLFYRQGTNAMAVELDIKTVVEMMKGTSYTDAAFPPEVKTQYEKTEEMMKKEDISNFPSLFQQARNLAKEMWITSKNAARGMPVIVDAETAFNRFSMCQTCEFLKQDFRCEKCGCFMKAKTQLASASCPIGKWAAQVS